MIRYTVINGQNWFSLNDIEVFLKEQNAIRSECNLSDRCIKEIAKRLTVDTNRTFQLSMMLAITPDDVFIHWTFIVAHFRYVLGAIAFRKTIHTMLIFAIDNFQVADKACPQIFKIFKQVKLIEQAYE